MVGAAVELGAVALAGAHGGRGRARHRNLLAGGGAAPGAAVARSGARSGAASQLAGTGRGIRADRLPAGGARRTGDGGSREVTLDGTREVRRRRVICW